MTLICCVCKTKTFQIPDQPEIATYTCKECCRPEAQRQEALLRVEVDAKDRRVDMDLVTDDLTVGVEVEES